MTIAAYQTLYRSAVDFGIRKQSMSERGKEELQDKIKVLEVKKVELEAKVVELKCKIEIISNRMKDTKEVDKK